MRSWSERVTRLEENVIAFLLAAITIVSFTQVVARYVFNTGWTGALEFTRILFAWLILFGMSYGVKMGSHLGVDVIIRLFPRPIFRSIAVFGAVMTLLYAVILLYADWLQLFGAPARGGAWAYWSRMFEIGLGLDDLRYPVWMQDVFGLQERVHRWLAYLMLPVGLALLALRSAQAVVQIIRGERETVIASHEAEELVAESKGVIRE